MEKRFTFCEGNVRGAWQQATCHHDAGVVGGCQGFGIWLAKRVECCYVVARMLLTLPGLILQSFFVVYCTVYVKYIIMPILRYYSV